LNLYTIGFTQKSAEQFFGLLRQAGVKLLIDCRLRPETQLSGFAKGRDLAYFVRMINGARYAHLPDLAPTDALLDGYRASKDWDTYARDFGALIAARRIETTIDRDLWAREAPCLLCSEHQPHQCHRRLVAEYLAEKWGEVTIEHLI
jgi:uncharacterized protein (DUF488 family)